jgi:hypothetical protein
VELILFYHRIELDTISIFPLSSPSLFVGSFSFAAQINGVPCLASIYQAQFWQISNLQYTLSDLQPES